MEEAAVERRVNVQKTNDLLAILGLACAGIGSILCAISVCLLFYLIIVFIVSMFIAMFAIVLLPLWLLLAPFGLFLKPLTSLPYNGTWITIQWNLDNHTMELG